MTQHPHGLETLAYRFQGQEPIGPFQPVLIGVVGSGNADLRSFMLNAEVSMLLYDPAQVAELVARQAECMALSDRLDLYEWRRRPMVLSLAENLARLVSPLL